MDWLPPLRIPAGGQTRNLLVYGMMLQVTEPPGQGSPEALKVKNDEFIRKNVEVQP